jgi:hypothetical protein
MIDWHALLQKPADLREPGRAAEWFSRMAAALLNGCDLVVAGEPHRFVEVEFYCCGDEHPDPFTHRDPVQLERGRWYFHRTRGVYRSGSFKGLDLTFGDGTMFGGALIRGVVAADGTLIDGPSLTVDHLLARTKARSVGVLDDMIAGRPAWDASSPLRLVPASPARGQELVRSARVGLSLKRARGGGEMPRFIMKPYRYLSEPRRTGKGKAHVVLALHAGGASPDEIHERTGCPRASVKRYVEDFEAGRQQADFEEYFGADLTPRDLCRLHGTWHETMRATP